MATMKVPDEPKNCLAAALRMLSRRDHSCSEITQKLIDRGFARDQIKWTVSECLRLHYLDDERYADGCARQMQRKGFGCRRIRDKLMSKGLNADIVDSCLENYCRENTQITICKLAMDKKIKSAYPPESPAISLKNKAKLYRFLFNRGFSPDIIRYVMEQASNPGPE